MGTERAADLRTSVVVATRDRRDGAVATVRRLLALPERPPVIVLDDASSDGTLAALRRLAARERLTVWRSEENLGAAIRNVGVALASTPYVAFADDDSWWAPGALTRAADVLDAHPRLAVLAATVLVGDHEALDPVCEAMAASPLGRDDDLPGPSILGFVACGAVVRREAFLAAGGFPAGYGVGGEEAPLALALAGAGWGLAHVPDVVAHHHPSPLRDPARRARRQVRNDIWSAWLRLPVRAALRETASVMGTAPRGVRLPAAGDAARGLLSVLRRRKTVPPSVVRRWELLRAAG